MNIEALFEQLLDEGYKIGAAFDTLIDENEFTAEEIKSLIEGLLIPTAMAAFSLKFTAMDESFSETNVQQIFEVFLQTEHLSEFENIIAQAINLETQKAYDAGINEEEETDSGVLNGPFETLSNDERIAAVKAFLAALANAHNDITNIRPFINQKIGNQADYLGNKWGEKVQVRSNRYGPAEFVDESFSRKHFETAAAAIRAIENKHKRQLHADFQAEIFSKSNPRFDHARFHKAAGTQYKPKNKTLKETGLLPSTPITEQLLNQQTSKIQKYADWMAKHPTFFNNQSDGVKQGLIEAAKNKAKHDQVYGLGKDEADWDPVTDAKTPGRRK